MDVETELKEGIYDLSLTKALQEAQHQADQAMLTISVGEMWIQKKSDVSYNVSAVLAKLSCSHKRLTAALSQLRYWTAANAYATSLPVSKLLMSWCGGSVLLMELIEAGLLMSWWERDLINQVPDLPDQLAQMYDL